MDQERHEELLTAYLDREMSPDERAALDRLLEQSPEARQRLLDLEATSNFLRRLPRKQTAQDFANDVIDRLRRESLLWPEPVVPQRRTPRWGGWVGGALAAAASLVLAVWMGRGMLRDDAPQVASVGGSRVLSYSTRSAMPAPKTAMSEDVAGTDSPPASSAFDLPGPGDAVLIVSESGDVEVGLMILQQQVGDDGLRGILLPPRDLPIRGVKSSSGEVHTDSIPTFVANDADVQTMAEVLTQWGSQNSAPFVDLAFESPTAYAASDGEVQRRSRVTGDRNIESRSTSAHVPERREADSLAPTNPRIAASKPPEKSSDASRGAATDPDKTAGREPPPAPAGVAAAQPAAPPAAGADKVTIVPGDTGAAGTHTAEATPEPKATRQREAPRKGGGYAYLERRRAQLASEPSDVAGRDSSKGEAAPAKSLDDLRKLAEKDNGHSVPRSSKPSDAASERLKVLLQIGGGEEPERRSRRN